MTMTQPDQEHSFGLLHAITLGIILFVGACLALPIQLVSTAVPMVNMPIVDSILWVVEILVYLALAWFFARRVSGMLVGLMLGMLTRLLASALILLLLHVPPAALLGELFAFNGTRSLLHALAVLIAAMAIALSYRPLLEFLGAPPRPTSTPAAKNPVRFSFDSRPGPAATPSVARVPLVLSDGEASAGGAGQPSFLQPPEDYAPVFPREEVTGTVTIPARVILESVPEAHAILSPNYNVTVRLAYLVPQLPRGTVWLTWKQVFEKGVPPLSGVDTAKLEPEFFSRWVRIPARHYVTQVPRDYFQTKKTSLAWMRLPAVEQEAEIKFGA